jgi:glycosyltransferase involved in cell wall biosynthesis
MRFVQYYPRAISDDSGVVTAFWAWVLALARGGHEVVVLHAGGRKIGGPVDQLPDQVTEHAIAHLGRGRTTWVPVGLERHLQPADVLVLHEGWILSNLAAARAAKRVGARYVVVPHGAHDPGVQRRLKPPVRYRRRLERRLLEQAHAVHVFFESEVATIHDLAPAARCIVAPTGFDLPNHGWVGGGGYVSWLGRYDPYHKGLDLLVCALASIHAERRPRMELRGHDFHGGRGEIRRLVQTLGLRHDVQIGGPVDGADKLAFLQRADAYVHPSRWESHSVALLENLSLGVPSLVSNAIHVAPDLHLAGAAIVVPPTVPDLAVGIERLLSADPTLGSRGRDFVATRFAWHRSLAAYEEGLARLEG